MLLPGRIPLQVWKVQPQTWLRDCRAWTEHIVWLCGIAHCQEERELWLGERSAGKDSRGMEEWKQWWWKLSCGSGFLNEIHGYLPTPVTISAVSWDCQEATIQTPHHRCWQVSLCQWIKRESCSYYRHYLEEWPDTTF